MAEAKAKTSHDSSVGQRGLGSFKLLVSGGLPGRASYGGKKLPGQRQFPVQKANPLIYCKH